MVETYALRANKQVDGNIVGNFRCIKFRASIFLFEKVKKFPAKERGKNIKRFLPAI